MSIVEYEIKNPKKKLEFYEQLHNENITRIEKLQKENNRLLELCMYALISSTKIYNHELANNTKKAFIDIIKNNLEDDTHTLREKIKFKWEHM